MKKRLPPWCKLVKHTLIDKDMDVSELATKTGLARPYLSSIINGRIYSQPAVNKVSDCLGISNDYDANNQPANTKRQSEENSHRASIHEINENHKQDMNENVYFECRKRAAIHNERLNSRAGAAEILGISESTLAHYELGITKNIPVDVVVMMAEVYNAPELKCIY